MTTSCVLCGHDFDTGRAASRPPALCPFCMALRPVSVDASHAARWARRHPEVAEASRRMRAAIEGGMCPGASCEGRRRRQRAWRLRRRTRATA